MAPSGYTRYVSAFFRALLYAVLVYVVQYALHIAGVFSFYPNAQSLVGWDAAWYKSIAEDGYLYWGGTQCNSGFFILFPFLWRVLHLGVWGVCVLNVVLFAAGFGIMVNLFKPGKMQQWLWLTVPPLYFAFVPYTEAVSFLLVSICLYGIVHNRKPHIMVSLFLLSLTRVSVTFLAPALVVMELVATERQHWRAALKKSLWLYLLPAFAGLALFVWYQYHVTGKWFLYFMLQAEYWGHKFSWPSFPFISSYQSRTILLSGFATVCGVAAACYLLYVFMGWLRGNRVQAYKPLVLSLGYLTATLLLTLFFNPKAGGRTIIVGITRYTMCTPFFFILLQYFTQSVAYKKVYFLYAFVAANVVLLAFRSYYDIGTFLYFNIAVAALLLYMLYANRVKWAGFVLIAIGFIAQVLLFQDFLTALHYPD